MFWKTFALVLLIASSDRPVIVGFAFSDILWTVIALFSKGFILKPGRVSAWVIVTFEYGVWYLPTFGFFY